MRCRSLVPLILFLSLSSAACASEPQDVSEEVAGPTAGSEADTTAADDGDAARIVSLSATSTEVLFAIGAGDQVVAVDEHSNHPEEAPTTDLSGFQPNVEAIAAYEPDVVFASSDPGDLVDSLAALDIEVVVHNAAATLDEAFQQILATGEATGHAASAEALVADMQAEIDQIVTSTEIADASLTYFHELDPTFYTVTSSTFIGEVYGLLGLTSIADAAGDDDNPYPQLSPEFIIEADPDLIFLADAQCCGVDADEVAARPGWSTMTAVERDAIVVLDEDVASRWGPRIVDFVRAIADEVEALAPAA